MARIATRPLNRRAVQQANDDFYRDHRELVQNGWRVPLDPCNPQHGRLRDEWMDLYEEHNGRVRRGRFSPDCDQPVIRCQQLAEITIMVNYSPMEAPVRGAMVYLQGPASTMGEQTDDQGVAVFSGLSPGGYQIEARLDSGSSLVDEARRHIGSRLWALNANRPPYPRGRYKCNLFVYEVANRVGYLVPRRTRWSWSERRNVWYPPLAGDWANPSEQIGSWQMVTDPEPGDVIAERIDYSDATGHMGIVSYPAPNGESRTLSTGDHVMVIIVLERRTISAATRQVRENDWGWRSGQNPRFRRYTP